MNEQSITYSHNLTRKLLILGSTRLIPDRLIEMSILHYGEESVSVAIEEVRSQDWAQEVYKPDIQQKWDKLYKKPGYTM